ncbi:amidase [Paenibacillus soyae]|uniref:Amidase n=1 Tax=Paenibacillus soyae TaxID=2969249 RepID=A0A9X2MWJ0_9BACL|nr:amidase [Paenibacillus soyae]MCR2807629.1 amidase [Paenibacillus soyae]
MKNNWNAYANESLRLEPTAAGPLSGLTFAVKDVFHIAGETAGAGNPDWLRTHGPASKHAAVIGRLLENGARMEGTTITDELMYSINGENVHYGTPRNPNAPGRIPGGSSSGSAVAAAAGLADFAVGTDTGGSVRVPASYCGVYGIRPSHGAVSVEGLIPLAPSFDTVGWMARDPETMLRVGRALLPQTEAATEQEHAQPVVTRHGFGRLLLARDMWALSDACTSDALSSCLPALRELIPTVQDVEIAPEGFSVWMNAFRILQGSEIWEQHGGWLESVRPSFGPGIAERFRWIGTIGEDKRTAASLVRRKASRRMAELMDESTLIIAPTVPSIAPPLNGSGEAVERRRSQTLQLSCVAGLSGLPQVTLPLQGEGRMPIGLSFIAARGQDLRLLEWLAFVSSALPAHRFG